MTNMQKLNNSENKNYKLFAQTILNYMNSQGFYNRLHKNINEMNDAQFEGLEKILDQENFTDILDVVFFLEC